MKPVQALLVARNSFGRPGLSAGITQRRWARVHDVRFITTHQPDRILEKYKEKLAQKAKAEGHDSISSLKEAYNDKIQARREADAAIPRGHKPPVQNSSTQDGAAAASPQSKPSQPVSASQKLSPKTKETPGIKPLSSYIDVEKIRALPPDEISKIWRARHVSDHLSICAAIPLETYNRIIGVARKHPQFILPLPREIETPSDDKKEDSSSTNRTAAAEMHFLQWAFHPPSTASPSSAPNPPITHNTHTSTVIFTHLAAFKLHGAYAPPHTTITHHLDLADEKGIVLMNGSVVADRGVTTDEAHLLTLWLQRFYDWGPKNSVELGGRKGELLRMFTRGDTEGFKIDELIEEVQKA